MQRVPLFFATLLLLVLTQTVCQAQKKSSLRKAILANYDKNVNPDEAITVGFGIMAMHLGYCPYKQILTLRSWNMQIWNDSRLAWDPEAWENIDSIRLPAEDIWLPDVTLYESQGSIQLDYLEWEKIPRVVVKNTGEVIFIPPVTYKIPCVATTSPEDPNSNNGDLHAAMTAEKTCTFKFGSWVYGMKEMDIQPSSEHIQAFDTALLKTDRTEVTASSVTRNELVYPCCPDEKYPNLEYSVSFKLTEMAIKRMAMMGHGHGQQGGIGGHGHGHGE